MFLFNSLNSLSELSMLHISGLVFFYCSKRLGDFLMALLEFINNFLIVKTLVKLRSIDWCTIKSFVSFLLVIQNQFNVSHIDTGFISYLRKYVGATQHSIFNRCFKDFWRKLFRTFRNRNIDRNVYLWIDALFLNTLLCRRLLLFQLLDEGVIQVALHFSRTGLIDLDFLESLIRWGVSTGRRTCLKRNWPYRAGNIRLVRAGQFRFDLSIQILL